MGLENSFSNPSYKIAYDLGLGKLSLDQWANTLNEQNVQAFKMGLDEQVNNFSNSLKGYTSIEAAKQQGLFYDPNQSIFNKYSKSINGKSLTDKQLKSGSQYASAATGLIGNAFDAIGGGSGTQDGTITSGVNQLAQMGESMPGMAGAIAKSANALNKVANNTYNKIDQYEDQSTMTQLMGSNMFGILGANRWDSKKFGTFGVDPTLRAKLGAAYGGSFKDFDYVARNISGKRIGTFDRNKMQDKWDNALNQYSIASKILSQADDMLARSSEMASINANRRAFELAGGYNLSGIYAAKEGMKLPEDDIKYDIKEAPENYFIPEEAPDSSSYIGDEFLKFDFKESDESRVGDEFLNFNFEEPLDEQGIIDYVNSSKAPFVKRLLDPNRETIPDWKDLNKVANFKMSYANGIDENGNQVYFVYPEVQVKDGQLHDFTDPKYKHGEWDAMEYAKEHGNRIKFDNEVDAKWFIENYKQYYPSFNIEKFAKGGAVNVIPEGALHARKHNMDIEGITNKGIPVISELNDGKIQQQAEIEHSEIIFRKEVTELLEELMKDYEKAESQKDKDDCAIEAGKLLAEEILYNTDDRTNLIQQVQ